MPPRLKWLPLPVDIYGHDEKYGSIAPPAGLQDFQVGWYWNLFWSVLGHSADTGVMSCARSKLWIVAGAHSQAFWDAKCARVMAAFEVSTLAGSSEQIVVSHPQLIRIVAEQLKKLKNHKKRGEGDLHNFNSLPQMSGDLSPPLQSGFAFDLEDPIQIQNQKQNTARACAPAHEMSAKDTSQPAAIGEGYSGRQKYTQADFDARDQRKMTKAWDELAKRNAEGATRASGWSNRRMFEYVCEAAGVSIARGLELEAHRKKWPEKVPDWLKEETG